MSYKQNLNVNFESFIFISVHHKPYYLPHIRFTPVTHKSTPSTHKFTPLTHINIQLPHGHQNKRTASGCMELYHFDVVSATTMNILHNAIHRLK